MNSNYFKDYSYLGGPCYKNSIALSSNHKFLPPLDSLYFQNFTYMYRYPASNISKSVEQNTKSIPNPSNSILNNNNYKNKPSQNCSSC
jgi:hypothetical protein